ncbi:Hint domain-containing protein [Acidiphilium sp.]|uniref:Hint domain-containing protein n=1 Tax=Acidiphilium sp. TaxID=527 RepID=UPI003D080423
MSSTLQIIGPALIDLIDGTTITALDLLPPGGLALSDSNTTALSVTLTSGVSLAASSAGGATVISGTGALTLTGDLAEINAALASLVLAATTVGTTSLAISASDGSTLATTTLAVITLPDPPPAFITPPSSLTLTAGIASALGLTLADDPASALQALGAAPEDLAITLEASSGMLLLAPGAYAGIDIAGDATGAITLTATSSRFALLNAALGAITLDAASAGTLAYIASQTSGPLAITDTSGSLTYAATGTLASTAETWAGAPLAWQNASAWSGDATPGLGTTVTIGTGATVSGYGLAAALTIAANAIVDLEAQIGLGTALLTTAATLDLGDAALSIAGSLSLDAASLFIGPDATLAAGGVTIGTASGLIDFGTMTLNGLDVIGEALLPGGATLDGPLGIAAGGLIDFAGTIQAGLAATSTTITAISLATNATLAGAGTIIAGNFSNSATIAGPGTIVALGPAPLEILAGSVGGGAQFVIDPGASLEFGAVAALYGVFDNTPITIGSSATISFAPGASPGQDTTGNASALGEQGGVLILDNPESFAATILGFLPGDRIDLATLTSLSIFNVTSSAFEVEGAVIGNTTQSEILTIHAALGSLTPQVETDAAGAQLIGLRAATAALTLNDTPATSAVINAANGFTTPIENLGLLVPGNATQGLTLTIAASTGAISDGGAATNSLTLSAATALSLNADLAALSYTAQATGSGAVLNVTGGTGLAGLSAAIAIDITAPATLDFTGANGAHFNADPSWAGRIAPAGGDIAAFASHNGAPLLVIGPGVAGAVSIGGAYDFAGAFDLAGSAGIALDIGGGGLALFDANALVTLGAVALVGDSHGTGTLGIAGTLYAPANITVGGTAPGSLLDITGSLAFGQTLALGTQSAATFDLTGDANFAAVTLGGTGTGETGLIRAAGSATLGLGSLDILAGTISLTGDALATADATTLTSGMILLDGQSSLSTPFGLDLSGGTLAIRSEAAQALGPGTLTIGTGALLHLAGDLSAAALALSGTATIDGGRATITGALSLASGAALTLAGGTLATGSLTLAGGATLAGSGQIGAATTGVALIPIAAAGTLEATGGTLTLGGTLTGNATIAATAALDLVGPASGGTIGFAGADALLTLNEPTAMQDAVANFASGDAIDLIGIAPSLVSVSGGIVTIASHTEFALAEAPAAAAATITADGTGGADITVGGAMPCFTRGTALLTPTGYRPVETLRPGDRLITHDGAARPIRWIGWRTIDLARDPAAALLRPVIIAPGAFGPFRPRRPLAVSPLHAILGAGGLVPAILLVNNATITRDETGFAITYYHVELDRHAIVFAEALHTETYRDNGNRDRFLDHLGTPGAPMPACAPLILGGAELSTARAALHRRATALGHKIIHGPEAAAILAPRHPPITPRRRGQRLIFDLPHPATHLTLRCRTGMASDTDPASEDRRPLGLCAGTLRADGHKITNWAGQGWHPRAPGDRGLWSTDRAELTLPRAATRISLEVLGSIPRWVRDAADLTL